MKKVVKEMQIALKSKDTFCECLSDQLMYAINIKGQKS